MDIDKLATSVYEDASLAYSTETYLRRCANAAMQAAWDYKEQEAAGDNFTSCITRKMKALKHYAKKRDEFARTLAEIIVNCLLAAKNEDIEIDRALQSYLGEENTIKEEV